MAGSASDYLELKQLDHALGGPDYTRPATVYVGLFTALSADGTNTELSGGAYARVATTNNSTNWPGASAGSKSNGTAVNFTTPSADWGEVVGFGIFDASTSGNLLYWGELVAATKYAFTAVASTDIITAPGHGYSDGQAVKVWANEGAVLPTGIVQGTKYFVRDTSGDTFKLAATSGGTAINLTANGAGVIAANTSQTISAGNTVGFGVGTLVISQD